MGFIFSMIVVAAILTFVFWYSCGKDNGVLKGWAIAFPCIILTTCCIAWGCSYSSYLGLKEDQASVEQYVEAINLYSKKGLKEFKGSSNVGEITDLKYQQYQSELAALICHLRKRVVDYNECLTSKKIMKASPFWSAVIILPPDETLKPMAISELVGE